MAYYCEMAWLKPIKLAVLISIYCLTVTVGGIVLFPGKSLTVVLPSKINVPLYTGRAKNGTVFMLQLHSQVYNVSLCGSSTFNTETCKTGKDIGMYLTAPTSGNDTNALGYARLHSTSNATVLAYLTEVNLKAPLAGACNQVFNLELDPNLALSYSDHETQLFFQWANQLTFVGTESDCEDTWIHDDLKYTYYVYYLGWRDMGLESYLDTVSKMLTASDIVSHGQMIEGVHNTGFNKPLVQLASESSRGAIYSVVVHSRSTGHSAAYVTAATYNCNLSVHGDCDVEMKIVEIILVTVCAVVGLYLLLLGHRMFHVTQFVCGYLLSFMLVFLLMSMGHGVHWSVTVAIACCVGVIGGLMCLAVWYYFYFPIVSVLVPGLCAGYLVAATVFFSPFGRISWWESNQNYILAYICVILIYTVLLMTFSKFLSIVSTSLLGSYLLLMCVAVPTRASLRLIYLYTEYRQTNPDFVTVKSTSPALPIDIGLFVLWPIVLIMGVCFQYYREIGRPHFEPFDLKRQQRLRSGSGLTHSTATSATSGRVDSNYEVTDDDDCGGNDGETNSLLKSTNSNKSSYKSVADRPHEP